ncbi:MAG: hypothetical protein N2170_07475 [Bacteroidia bacterium]|nr:hypothetical protein [Bacteroidia bacterium]
MTALLVWIGGCSPSDSQVSQHTYAVDTTSYAIPWEQIEVYMKAAPSPVQVAMWLRQEKVPFYGENLHDPTLAGRYSGLQGAANLGVYLTDMAYAHATAQYQKAYEYLSSVNRLASLYGVEDILSAERIKRLDRLQDQPDSVQKLFTQYYGEIQERLTETGQQAMLRHMILGGWSESLHIVLTLLEKDPKSQPLAEVIFLQKGLLPLLMKLYSVDTASSAASREIVAHLAAIQGELEQVAIQEVGSTDATVQKGVIHMRFRQRVVLSPVQVQSLRRRLLPLRQFIVRV